MLPYVAVNAVFVMNSASSGTKRRPLEFSPNLIKCRFRSAFSPSKTSALSRSAVLNSPLDGYNLRNSAVKLTLQAYTEHFVMNGHGTVYDRAVNRFSLSGTQPEVTVPDLHTRATNRTNH